MWAALPCWCWYQLRGPCSSLTAAAGLWLNTSWCTTVAATSRVWSDSSGCPAPSRVSTRRRAALPLWTRWRCRTSPWIPPWARPSRPSRVSWGASLIPTWLSSQSQKPEKTITLLQEPAATVIIILITVVTTIVIVIIIMVMFVTVWVTYVDGQRWRIWHRD